MNLFRRGFHPHRTAPCLNCNKRYDAHQNHFHRLKALFGMEDCPYGDCGRFI